MWQIADAAQTKQAGFGQYIAAAAKAVVWEKQMHGIGENMF